VLSAVDLVYKRHSVLQMLLMTTMMMMMMMGDVLCRFAEWMVMISFIVLAMTWLTKKPGFFKGWMYLMPEHDMLVSILLFTSLLLAFKI